MRPPLLAILALAAMTHVYAPRAMTLAQSGVFGATGKMTRKYNI